MTQPKTNCTCGFPNSKNPSHTSDCPLGEKHVCNGECITDPEEIRKEILKDPLLSKVIEFQSPFMTQPKTNWREEEAQKIVDCFFEKGVRVSKVQYDFVLKILDSLLTRLAKEMVNASDITFNTWQMEESQAKSEIRAAQKTLLKDNWGIEI